MDDLSHEQANLERILDGIEKPGKLKLPVLRLITANFSDDRKIGEGGFCSVYKVKLIFNYVSVTPRNPQTLRDATERHY